MEKLFRLYILVHLVMGQGAVIRRRFSMPITNILQEDSYICAAFDLDDLDEIFFESFTFDVIDKDNVHHVSAGICEEPISTKKTWECSKTIGHNCKGAAVHLAGWDHFTDQNNGDYKFPRGLTARLGSKANLKKFILSIHYNKAMAANEQKRPAAIATLTLTKTPTPLFYQSYLLTNTGTIPGNRPHGFFSNAACIWSKPPAFAFDFFVHTHHYGVLVEGYIIRNKTWILLGSQLSQSKLQGNTETLAGPVEIKPGDIVASRCLFINKEETAVKFGTKDHDEMCTFHMSIGFDPKYERNFTKPMACASESPTFSFCNFPKTLGKCADIR